MKLLIDTNVLLDVLQNREPFAEASSLIWEFCETGIAEGYVSALTFADLVYIMRKQLDPEKTEETLHRLSLILSFTELTPADLKQAAGLRWDDFEDAVQSVTAERLCADYIITRNVRDFAMSKVVAVAPSDFIARLAEE